MKVLHILQTLKGGGAETLVRELIPRLRARGIDANALTMYAANLTPAERAAIGGAVVEVKRRGRFDLPAPYRLWKAIKFFQPDIVHTHVITGKYWGRAAAALAGIPLIVHTEHSPRSTNLFWEPAASLLLTPRTAATITFSDRTRQFIEKRERVKRVIVIPNGIEIPAPVSGAQRAEARRALGKLDDVVIIGIVANLYPQKNHGLALRALRILKSTCKQKVRLDIFGSGPQDDFLRRTAKELGVETLVNFHGFTPNIRSLLPGIDVFLSVALVEAAPISYLEAMGAGLPIIGTPSIGTLDMVDDNITGLITKGWQEDDVASAITKAVENHDWRLMAGEKSREMLVTKYDIEIVADRHAALYRHLFSTS